MNLKLRANSLLVLLVLLSLSTASSGFGSTSNSSSVVTIEHSVSSALTASSLEIISKTSVFKDSYFASEISDVNSFTLTCKKRPIRKTRDEVYEYVTTLGVIAKDKEKLVEILLSSDKAIVGWLETIDSMNIPELHRLRLAKAADKLRLQQIRLEASIFQLVQYKGLILSNSSITIGSERGSVERQELANILEAYNFQIRDEIVKFQELLEIGTMGKTK